MNESNAAKILAECLRSVMYWMQDNDITIDGEDAIFSTRSALLSVTEGLLEKLKNGRAGDRALRSYAGMILACRIVEQVVNDEGVTGVTLTAEILSDDEIIRRKAQNEVNEMKAEGDKK